jgi:hypothetical protein
VPATDAIGSESLTAMLVALVAEAVKYRALGREVPESIAIKINRLKRWLGLEATQMGRGNVSRGRVLKFVRDDHFEQYFRDNPRELL